VLPLELGDPGIFGDDLQHVSGFIAFRLEPAGGAIIIPRAGEVGTARRSRGITRHGRSCGWCKGRIPLDEPENIKRIVRGEKGSKRTAKKPTITTSGEHLHGLKDRLGDQRGGSEWEPIKILLEGD
jgi:hypothetical protein